MIYYSFPSYGIGYSRLPIYGVNRRVNCVWRRWPSDRSGDQSLPLMTCNLRRLLFDLSLHVGRKKTAKPKKKTTTSQGVKAPPIYPSITLYLTLVPSRGHGGAGGRSRNTGQVTSPSRDTHTHTHTKLDQPRVHIRQGKTKTPGSKGKTCKVNIKDPETEWWAEDSSRGAAALTAA